MKNNKIKKICKTHPHALWGVDQHGDFYPECVAGRQSNQRMNTICEELVVKGGEQK